MFNNLKAPTHSDSEPSLGSPVSRDHIFEKSILCSSTLLQVKINTAQCANNQMMPLVPIHIRNEKALNTQCLRSEAAVYYIISPDMHFLPSLKVLTVTPCYSRFFIMFIADPLDRFIAAWIP